MASATLSDAIEKVHDAAANSVAQVQSHAGDLKSDLPGYKDEIVSAVGSAYDASKRTAQRAMKGAGQAYGTARDYTVDGVKSATRAARSHPVTTVAIAAGVGLLVGAFLMMRRR
jgi:ElaB/YqjD/DUF883 family membrane-anchored ribosome-binding protein